MRSDGEEMHSIQEPRFFWKVIDCVLFFFSSTLSDEWCSDWSFENPNANPKNHTQNSHGDTLAVYIQCVCEVTMYKLRYLPFKKLGSLTVQLWPPFLLQMKHAPTWVWTIQTRWIVLRAFINGDRKNKKTAMLLRKHWNHMQVTNEPQPDVPSLTQTIIVQMVYSDSTRKLVHFLTCMYHFCESFPTVGGSYKKVRVFCESLPTCTQRLP